MEVDGNSPVGRIFTRPVSTERDCHGARHDPIERRHFRRCRRAHRILHDSCVAMRGVPPAASASFSSPGHWASFTQADRLTTSSDWAIIRGARSGASASYTGWKPRNEDRGARWSGHCVRGQRGFCVRSIILMSTAHAPDRRATFQGHATAATASIMGTQSQYDPAAHTSRTALR